MSHQLALIRYAALIVGTLAILALSYVLASAPTREASRLGLRGLKKQQAEENELWTMFEPLVRWFGLRLTIVTPASMREAVHRQLVLSGDVLGLLPEEFLALSLLSGAAGAGAGTLIGYLTDMKGTLPIIIGASLGLAMPYLGVSSYGSERIKRINQRLPYVTDLLALAMSAGLDFLGAVRSVVEKSSNAKDPLIEELTLLLQELQLGQTRKQALLDFADRVQSDAVNQFVGAIVQAEERGNPLGNVLQIQAQVSRQQRSVRAEEAASKAGVRMVGPLFLVFFCTMILVIAPMILALQGTGF